MLQKPQTKFGYARRIFALPVLFTVAFAYMVNAKNNEIAKTNIEIEKAVSEIKKDTISPKNNIDQIVERQEAKISKASEKLKIQSEKLKTISEKSKEKAAELKKIAKEKGENSYDFELKAKELKQLSNEMDKIVDNNLAYQLDFENIEKARDRILAQNPKFKVENLEFKRIFPDGDNYKIQMNGKELDFDKMFDSKEFRENSGLNEEKIKEIKEKLKTPEFKGKLDHINKLYLNGNHAYSDSNFPKFELESRFKDTSNLSKKEIRRLEKLAKQKAELSRKQAEISKKQAEIVRQKAQNNPWIISVDAHVKPDVSYSVASKYADSEKKEGNKIVRIQTSRKVTDGNDNLTSGISKFYVNGKDSFEGNMKITIDGKVSSKDELNDLNPNNIRDINVRKNNVNGKMEGEISVNTKKKK